ncbi:MAG: hypothetical protein ROZ37_06380 [Aromatoleum sp.]|jgi:hypothetical protein|uniref:hypothetical protein n=1 Tax=Aromatoleum sp. TaxID=2307007 RepID=UPI002895C5FC|nr:hypothetical protein [Aromatoleum sp.]MDT3669941.1 hypothetical protein [Aromatoleum sp.]
MANRPQPDKTHDPQRAGHHRAGGMAGEDARGDASKQRENQERIGVTPEHNTEEMEKKHRGTFP